MHFQILYTPPSFQIKNQAQQDDLHSVTLPLCFALVLQGPLKGQKVQTTEQQRNNS